MTYKIYICGPGDCPNDDAYMHDSFYGCIPKNFSYTTGRSRGHRQILVEIPGYGQRYRYDGGCDAAGIIPTHWRPDGTPANPDAIHLEMG